MKACQHHTSSVAAQLDGYRSSAWHGRLSHSASGEQRKTSPLCSRGILAPPNPGVVPPPSGAKFLSFFGCRSCGSDSLGAQVVLLCFGMSPAGTPPHVRPRSRSRTPPPVRWALGLPEEIVDHPPRGWACLLEASLLEASLFVFEASPLEACFLEASLSVSFRWVFGGPGHLRGVQHRFLPASSKLRRPGARDPPAGDIVYVTLPSRAAIASVLDVIEAWGILFYLGGGPAAPQTSLFGRLPPPRPPLCSGGILAPPNPGVVPPPSGAKFALQDFMNRETNRDTGQPISAVGIPNAILILEGSPPLTGWLFGRLTNWLKP